MVAEFQKKREPLEQQWAKGLGSDQLLLEYSDLVDHFIVRCFDSLEVDGKDSVALVALGGYGRRELFPRSDIDLMILYKGRSSRVNSIADGILYPLWDLGLEVGHGVRTVKESVAQAREEYFSRVALLDSRLVCGNEQLFSKLMKVYRKRFVDGRREDFVVLMKEHRAVRQKRFGSHGYLLEPNIKESRGGMRDIQAMFWTAKMVFGLDGLDDMCGAGLLLDEEREEFVGSRQMLTRLRGYLHSQSRRKNEQLYFEQQEDAAAVFGYRSRSGVLGVESFMRDIYAALQNIAVITDLFFDHVDEVLGLAAKVRGIKDKNVEKGIEIRKGKIHLTAGIDQLRAKPHILVRLFLVMARTGLVLHYRTRKMIAGHLGLIDGKVCGSPRLTKAFVNILLEAGDIFPVLETMLETGVLTACIPEFSRIVTLSQYDVYHIYTVDRHSLQTVAELKQLQEEMGRVFKNVRSLKVLYLGALLHDIGKGSGRDHSIEGAGVAMEVGKRLGLNGAECDGLQFLVRYHLFIPENALRRDLNDTLFLRRCAETIGSLDRLSMLYLLSVADSKATGPSAWSSWKAALMEELYLKVYPYLDFAHRGRGEIGVELEDHVEQGVEWLRGQVGKLLAKEKGLRVDVATLSADYMLSFEPEVIVDHVLNHRDHYQLLRQKSLVRAVESEDGWSLLIMSFDRPGLLAKICGVMALNNLEVVRAQIFTWDDGTVVDVIDVRPTDGLDFQEKDWRGLNEDLDKAISHRLGLGHRLYRKLSSVYGRKRELAGEVTTKVVIDNNSSDIYSVVEVYSADLPGHLYRIAQTLADFGINIHKAYIATEVGQLIDVFYVLDSRGKKLLDEEFRQEITQGLLYSVGQMAS
ncbi:bifunctional uridylyltransferase/uridylyl-removing enzyme [Desulfomarina profundi]|uniref:Bifunctional uridylyltransferase/uridylyl-removing enzyme n=1 Tax=Desulfomarina profundi TaxID=2772557 RepID=A0A8D5FJR7_9BACT|nr:[protein-PII] uridylyltransferase [Desulfomarina profundi]BCL59459.1 bifunctional uridylyltransferase/uridylyl-removing enzyme [Desulfomarina profundi]